MDIIIIRGKQISGKTEKIKRVYQLLLEDGAEIIEDWAEVRVEDFSCIVSYHGKKVALYSLGDFGRHICAAIDEYANKECDMLICSCHKTWVCVETKLENYNVIEIEKTFDRANIEKANEQDAKKIINLLK